KKKVQNKESSKKESLNKESSKQRVQMKPPKRGLKKGVSQKGFNASF
ncbi:hypothetical protein HMPREF1420_01347, partial [Helicobacter pylori GAM264Ai]